VTDPVCTSLMIARLEMTLMVLSWRPSYFGVMGFLYRLALQALTRRLFRVQSESVPYRQPNTINASLVRQGKAHSFLFFLHADTAMQTQQTRAPKLDPTENAHAPFSTHIMLCC
jgi:hypothetical protein